MSSVSITGPASYAILHDPVTDRYFYFFGDEHFSLSGGCTGQPCDAPDFFHQKVMKKEGDCWTISALLHEVLTHFGKEGETVDFYLEVPFHEGSDPRRTKEMKARRGGLIEKPTTRAQADEFRARLEKEHYDWITDIYSMLHDKNYGSSVRVINGDARFWNGTCIAPMIIPGEQHSLHNDFAEAVEDLYKTGDRQIYQLRVRGILSDLEDLVAITEQLLSDPYLFLRQYFEPIDFEESTRTLLHYIPNESPLGKRMTRDLQKAIQERYGVLNSKGQLASPSAVAWTRLRNKEPELATRLNLYIREDLEGKTYRYQQLIAKMSDLLAGKDLSYPENLRELLPAFQDIDKFITASVATVSSVLDYYLLSEMLRSETKHNIAYLGWAHVDNCVSFLTQNGCDLLEEQRESRLADGSVSRCKQSLLLRELLQLDAARSSV